MARERVLAFRIARQHLGERTPDAATAAFPGLQDTPPGSAGAALADPDRPTVSVSGDGGFLFACGELATMAQEQIPLTVVIVDDGGYGMLRYDQVRAGAETFGVDLHTPDFEAMAASFGVWAETVFVLEEDFGEALSRHVETGQPSVLVAKTPTPLVPPPNTSPNWYRKR